MGSSGAHSADTLFLMEVQDVYFVEGRGVELPEPFTRLGGLAAGGYGLVATGNVVHGLISAGEEIGIVGLQHTTLRSSVAGVDIMPTFRDVQHMSMWRELGHIAVLLG